MRSSIRLLLVLGCTLAAEAALGDVPVVAYNAAAHEFLVVWEHEVSESDHDIVGQRVSLDVALKADGVHKNKRALLYGKVRAIAAGRFGLAVFQVEEGSRLLNSAIMPAAS